MSAKTVTIDHPHAEVIAAYYSGKTVEYNTGDEWRLWGKATAPSFCPATQYRIKPEPLVRWLVVTDQGATVSAWSIKPQIDAREGYRIVRMVEQPE